MEDLYGRPKLSTLSARASRICLRISPRLGAGTWRKSRYASRALSSAARSSSGAAFASSLAQVALPRHEARTVLTRARISPVAGHLLSRISPEPPHVPSYTPDTSAEPDVGMSSASRIVDARDDRERFRCAFSAPVVLRASMVVVGRVQAAGDGERRTW
jgi:hypothetical protein